MRRIHSTFQKLALAFLMFGVLPLLLVCLLSMERYEANARLIVELYLLPQADEGAWCNGSSDKVISLARNYMDVRTLDGAAHRVLGTLYVDVRTDALASLLGSLRLGTGGNAAVADGQGNILCRLKGDVDIPTVGFIPESGRFSRDGCTVFCQDLGSGGLRLLVSFDEAELYSAYTSSRVFVFVALAIAGTAVLILGLLLSSRMSQPARELQQAMRCV